jgi:hypothetical protein
MILRILLYGLVLYLAYKYIVQPLISSLKGAENKEGKVNYRQKETFKDKGEGEYIDYEEVNGKD